MKIGFFGCSFTEGGGIDSEEWYQYAIKNGIWEEDDYKQERIQSGGSSTYYRQLIRDRHRFSTLVGNKLNCEVENFAVSRNSNENIINQVYENIDKFDIFVVQFTIYTRRYIWNEPENKFYNISGVDFLGHPYLNNEILKPLHETYLNYVTYHHNDEYEHKKLEMYVNLFEKTGKEFYWMFVEDPPEQLLKNSNLIKFGDGSMWKWAMENKLQFVHATDGFYDDSHLNLEGNKLVAKKIVEKIND